MHKILLIISLIVLTLIPAAKAQTPAQEPPVAWSIATKMTGADSGVLTITATPSKGWHLYGTALPEGGPKPTSIDLSGSTGVTFDGLPAPSSQPLTVDDPLFGMKLTWWDKPVSFSVRFRIADGRPSGRIKAKMTYMACDDNTCAPPATSTLFRNVKRGK